MVGKACCDWPVQPGRTHSTCLRPSKVDKRQCASGRADLKCARMKLGASGEPSSRREAWDVGGATTASRGMMLYNKIHEDITLRSQAERQREGKFRYRRVRVFEGNLLWSGLPRLFAFFFSSSPCKDKTKNREWIERILRLCHVYFANKRTDLKSKADYAQRVENHISLHFFNIRTSFPSPFGIILRIHLAKSPWKMSGAFEVSGGKKTKNLASFTLKANQSDYSQAV